MRTPGRRDTLLAYGQVESGGLVRELPQGPHILSIVWQVRDRLMHSPLPADRASRPITCCHLLLQFPTRCDEAALDAIAQHARARQREAENNVKGPGRVPVTWSSGVTGMV